MKKSNQQIIREWIIETGYMPEEKLKRFEEDFGCEPVNTKSGWKKLGYFVIQAYKREIPIPDELGYAGAQRALNKWDMTSYDSRAERDYVSQVRKELAERRESAEFPIAEIPLWRKVGNVWILTPTSVYARRQVEPSKERLKKSMFVHPKVTA